jgi:hypothetical protein
MHVGEDVLTLLHLSDPRMLQESPVSSHGRFR